MNDNVPMPVYKEVERILDENSAWIARPSPEVTQRVALSATIAAHRVMSEIAAKQFPEIVERVRKTMCPTYSSDGGSRGIEGRISEADFDALVAFASAA